MKEKEGKEQYYREIRVELKRLSSIERRCYLLMAALVVLYILVIIESLFFTRESFFLLMTIYLLSTLFVLFVGLLMAKHSKKIEDRISFIQEELFDGMIGILILLPIFSLDLFIRPFPPTDLSHLTILSYQIFAFSLGFIILWFGSGMSKKIINGIYDQIPLLHGEYMKWKKNIQQEISGEVGINYKIRMIIFMIVIIILFLSPFIFYFLNPHLLEDWKNIILLTVYLPLVISGIMLLAVKLLVRKVKPMFENPP